MFVLPRRQCVVLPTRADAPQCCGIFNCYHTLLDHCTTNINRKVHAPKRISALGAPNNFQNCHLDKTNMDKTSQHLKRKFICFIFFASLYVFLPQGIVKVYCSYLNTLLNPCMLCMYVNGTLTRDFCIIF